MTLKGFSQGVIVFDECTVIIPSEDLDFVAAMRSTEFAMPVRQYLRLSSNGRERVRKDIERKAKSPALSMAKYRRLWNTYTALQVARKIESTHSKPITTSSISMAAFDTADKTSFAGGSSHPSPTGRSAASQSVFISWDHWLDCIGSVPLPKAMRTLWKTSDPSRRP